MQLRAAEPLMPGHPRPPEAGVDAGWGVSASLLAHVAFAALVALSWRQVTMPPPLVESLPVDFLTADQYDRLTAPPAPGPAAEPVRPSAPEMVTATAMLSAAALADPKSRAGAAVLAKLGTDEKAVQLCDLEAIEQVRTARPDLAPERLIAFGAGPPLSFGRSELDAEGAAFRSAGRWYHLRYRCTLSPGNGRVVAFSFAVGAPVSAAEREASELLNDE